MMKKALLLLTLTGLFITNMEAQEKLNADTDKTELLWLGEKVTGQHNGTINLQSGWLNWHDNNLCQVNSISI